MNEEQLIKIYVPDAEELALKYSFGDLYDLAVERDEEAAEQLEASCANLPNWTSLYHLWRRCPHAPESDHF